MRRLWGALTALRRDRRGAISILAAGGMVMTMAGGALAVDMGSVYYESRRLQGIADSAALAAAGNIATATSAAQAAVTANNWTRTTTPPDVTTGLWTPDASRTVAVRFTPTSTNPNAVQVQLAIDTPLYFGRIFGRNSAHLVRRATAARIDLASFSVGSRLASLDGGIANALLGQLTGSTVSLTTGDYTALLGADIDLLAYTKALQTQASLTAGTYGQTLAATVTTTQALRALQNVLTAAGNSSAATAIGKMAALQPAGSLVPQALISLGQLGKQDRVGSGTSIQVNAYAVLSNLLQTAGGTRQLSLDLGTSIAGLTSVQATVVFGDRAQNSPWVAVTASGDPVISTAQTRIYLQATALATPYLTALGIGPIRLPFYAELAGAQARLSSLSCSQTARTAALEVQPSLGHVSIAELTSSSLTPMSSTPVESAAKIVSLPLLNIAVTASARADLSGNGWQTVNFSTADVDGRVTKTVTANGTATALAGSLTGPSLSVGVQTPLGVITNIAISNAIRPILATMGPLVDGVLASLLDTLGLHLGQADVRVNGVRCGAAALVA